MCSSRMGNCRSKNEERVPDSENIKPTNSGLGCDQKAERPISSRNNSSLNSSSTQRKSQNQNNNGDVIDSTKVEVNDLLGRIHEFEGTSENDKNYRYLDEMLTRCILKLDRIECNSSNDRSSRKEAIRGVNQAISILERKLEFNYDMKKLESSLSESRSISLNLSPNQSTSNSSRTSENG